jgi:SNF2 family DNA or RNA helicase
MEEDWETTEQIMCPECDKQLRVSPLQSLSKSNRVVFSSLSGFQNCSKLHALLKKLQHMQEKDTNTKSVVFSQFTSFLVLYLAVCTHCQKDLIEVAFVKNNIVFERLDGTMTHQVSDKMSFLEFA